MQSIALEEHKKVNKYKKQLALKEMEIFELKNPQQKYGPKLALIDKEKEEKQLLETKLKQERRKKLTLKAQLKHLKDKQAHYAVQKKKLKRLQEEVLLQEETNYDLREVIQKLKKQLQAAQQQNTGSSPMLLPTERSFSAKQESYLNQL